jgi:FkbM family methyltransferase
MTTFRTRLIQRLIHVNEALLFYPALKKFYRSEFGHGPLRVIDVGANKGQTIDFFLSLSPGAEIWGFEPNKKLFSRLTRKYESNARIHLLSAGVSSKAGSMLFQENMLDETSTYEALNPDSEYLRRKARIMGVSPDEIIVDRYETDVTTLADFLLSAGLHEIDVLKIDVEGHEFQVLRGLFTGEMAQTRIRYIQLEHHEDDMYLSGDAAKIGELLHANGFEEVKRLKHAFGNFYEMIYWRRFP